MSFGAVVGSLLGKAGSAFASGVGSAAGTAIGTKIAGGSTDNIYNIYQGGGGPGAGGVTLLDELALREIKQVEGAKQRTEQLILDQENLKMDKAKIDATLELGRLQLESEKLGLQYQKEVSASQRQAVSLQQTAQMRADQETGALTSLLTNLAVAKFNRDATAQPVQPKVIKEESNTGMYVAISALVAFGLIFALRRR